MNRVFHFSNILYIKQFGKDYKLTDVFPLFYLLILKLIYFIYIGYFH